WWEMGLLSKDFTAQWIAADDPTYKNLPAWGDFLWHEQAKSDGKTVFFRLPVTLPDTPIRHAAVKVAVDDTYELFINGREMGRHHRANEVRRYDVAGGLRPGRNVIAVRAWNDKGPFGFNFITRIQFEDGKTLELTTADAWKAS